MFMLPTTAEEWTALTLVLIVLSLVLSAVAMGVAVVALMRSLK